MSTRRSRITQNRTTRKITSTSQAGSEEIVNLVEVKEQAQDFFQKYQNIILGVVGGLLLLVGGYLIYKYLYIQPKEKSAVEAMYQAEMQFAKDSFAAALDNPGGGFEGFASIAENYGGTKAGNTAKFYAGVCNLNLGKYEDAIEYLEDYSPSDDITPSVKFGALGDAHAELGDLEKAASYYEKAANNNDNEFTAPFYLNKLGLLQFSQKKNAEALATFKKIFEKYPLTQEGREAEKYIARLEE
jgi:tetratricopeptide (TPR) repeat protein